MARVRFAGIVRLANHVQRELSGPITAARCKQLRSFVNEALELVDRTLQLHSASLRAIPGPTRRAVEFLRRVDFDGISPTAHADDGEPHESIVLRGLTGSVEHIAERIANGSLVSVDEISRLVSRIEASGRQSGWRPEHLTPRTREQLGWLRFLADAENFAGYRNAACRAVAAFEPIAPTDRWPRPISVHFRPTRSLFRVRVAAGRTCVLLPPPIITCDEAAFAELGRAMFGRRRRERNATLHELMMSEPYQEVQAELEALGGIVEDTRGMVHDLAAAFERVNAAYFGGQITRPRLTWNRTITAAKFGHYNYSSDTVMLSRALDRPEVPAFVVDHVMHHELLHKKHGVHWHGGRGHAHTAEFRDEERRFARYDEADQFLRRLAGG